MKPKTSAEKISRSSTNSIEYVSFAPSPQGNVPLWSRSPLSSAEKLHFVVCIDNLGQEVALEKGKIYQVLPDQKAAAHGELRIIDESGEDYLFPMKRFVQIELPQAAEEALLAPEAQRT